MDRKDLATQGANDRSPAAQSRQDWFGPAFDGFGAMAGLRDQMNRLFDSVFKDLTIQTMAVSWPSIEVQDKDGAYRIAAELPGLDEKDVEVSLQDGVLTIIAPKSPKAEAQAKRVPISTGQTVH